MLDGLGELLVAGVVENDVEAIEAVAAPVRHHVAAHPRPVLARIAEQVGAATALDARDLLVRCWHWFSLPGGSRPEP
jgi:hypothetical protein